MKIDVSPEMGMYRLLESYPYDLAGALSEYIDNSLQSYINATTSQKKKIGKLEIEINFDLKDRHSQSITVSDNSVGIEASDLSRAMKPATEPKKKLLSEFGIGMKAASIWIGRQWVLKSFPINSKKGYELTFDLDGLLAKNQKIVDVKEKLNKEIRSGVDIEISKIRDLSSSEVKATITELHDIYQIYLYRKKILKFKFTLNGTSSDLAGEKPRKPPKALHYPVAYVKKPSWAKEYLAFKCGKAKTWKEDISFEFDGLNISGEILVRDEASQTSNPGVVLFRYGRMIKGSSNRPYRPLDLLGSQNKAAPSKIYMELHLDGQKIVHTKSQFDFDEKRFLQALKNSEPVKRFIDQAEAHRPTYEADDKVRAFSKYDDIKKWLDEEKARTAKKTKDKNKGSGTKGTRTTVKSKPHTQEWGTLLPAHFPEGDTKQVVSNLIHEAKDIQIKGFSHACAILYRVLFESVLTSFIYKTGNFEKVKAHYYNEGQGKKKNHTHAQKKEQGIGLSMIIDWLLVNTDIYPDELKKELSICARSLKSGIPKLNNAVHCKKLIGSADIEVIRNETYELLSYLVKILVK